MSVLTFDVIKGVPDESRNEIAPVPFTAVSGDAKENSQADDKFVTVSDCPGRNMTLKSNVSPFAI